MNVHVKLIGIFKIGRFDQQSINFPEATKVQDVVESLQLPKQHFGIVLINGEHASSNSLLTDGDQLTIMPFVDGG